MARITALILMGGEGKRFSPSLPKQFCLLSGKPIYRYTLEQFKKLGMFSEILLVCHPDYVAQVQSQVAERVIAGGRTRQESTYLGLMACDPATDYALVHDAVRPFVSEKILSDNLAAVVKAGAVDTCIPTTDTLVQVDNASMVSTIPDRTRFRRGQTPQTFRYEILLQAHQRALKLGIDDASDDCRLVLEAGYPVAIVEGDDSNIKITSSFDLYLAEQLLRRPSSALVPSTCSLAGKRYLVLGGTRGIGSEICALLRAQGATALAAGRSSREYCVDLREHASIVALMAQIEREGGALDGVIHSAGFLKVGALQSLSEGEIYDQFAVNLLGVAYASRYAPLKPGGHLLTIASSSYTRGRQNMAVYSAAKAAVVNLTQGLAEEHPEWQVNSLVPSRTLTTLRTDNFPDEEPALLLKPQVVAEAVVALLGRSGITGHTIEVRNPR